MPLRSSTRQQAALSSYELSGVQSAVQFSSPLIHGPGGLVGGTSRGTS